MLSRAFWSVVVVCAFLPGASRAQDTGHLRFFHNYGYPYGPRVAPAWGYPGLTGGPFVTYATPPVSPGVFGHGSIALKGHSDGSPPGGSHCHPAVPVYGPLPATFDNDPLTRQWRNALRPRLVVYGWIGPYSALPRPKSLSVHVRPAGAGASGGPGESAPATGAGGNLTLSVKVPDPTAEVLVDGRPTTQTGTDRTYESPSLEAGRSYAYTVTARWAERGRVVEVTKSVTGAPGEVVRVDFSPPVIEPGK